MISLEKHVQQLRNVIAKHTGSSMPQVQTIIFVLDSEQIASRCGRSFKLTSSTLIGSRGAMSCSGFLILVGTTWVSPPRYYVRCHTRKRNGGSCEHERLETLADSRLQEDAGKSIESELFAALLQTKLIKSREESNYHR